MNSSLKNIQAAFGSVTFRYWVAANVAGVFLSLSAIGLTLFAFPSNLKMVEAESALSTAVVYLFFGWGMGLTQWLVLRQHFRKAYGWIVATTLATFFSEILYQAIALPLLAPFAEPSVWRIAPLFESDLARDLLSVIVCGLMTGFAQWLFFRSQHITGAKIWILAAVAAQLLSLTLPDIGITDPLWVSASGETLWGLYAVYGLAQSCLYGIILGGVTGLPLMGFIAQKKAQTAR